MSTGIGAVEHLVSPAEAADLRDLAQILVDAIDSGAAVSFLPSLTLERAQEWWRNNLASSPSPTVLVARDHQGIAGTVQLQPAWAPNQPHRAEIVKLLVHRRAQRVGLGTRLMESIEQEAVRAGFTLLTLNAKKGGAAEALYRRLGWRYVGTIPDFAVDPDGTTCHDAVFFYKRLTGL